MVAAASNPERDRIAIAASIALHLCVLAAVALVPRPSFPLDDPDERTLLTSVIRLEHHAAPAPTAAAVASRIAARAVPRAVPLPVVHAAITREHALRKLVVATEQRAISAPSPARAAKRVPAVVPAERTTAESAPAPATVSTSAPAAPASPAPTAAAVAVNGGGASGEGIGNFGETYPASIEPAARGVVFNGVSGVVVRVTVDENGRATDVEFVREPPDPAMRAALRARILDARFIPAACNGLRCTGTIVLRS